MRPSTFFVEGHLRRDAAFGLFERTASIEQAGDLLVSRTPRESEAVEIFVITGLNVQSRDDDGNR